MAGRGGAQRTNGTAASSKICQFKLVLLGESAVGKSSLVLRFVKGQFHEYQESTIGGERHWSPRDECAKLTQRSHSLLILTPLIFRKCWLLASGGQGGGGGLICCTLHMFGSWSLKVEVEQTPDWWYCH